MQSKLSIKVDLPQSDVSKQDFNICAEFQNVPSNRLRKLEAWQYFLKFFQTYKYNFRR